MKTLQEKKIEKLINKFIERIKIDYPEDDKLMLDLIQFKSEFTSLDKEIAKERIREHISDEEAVVSKWKREDKEIADELEQQPQEKEETVYDQLSRLHDFCCEKMENISQKMIDIDSLHLGRYRTYKVIVDWIKKQETPQQPDKEIADELEQYHKERREKDLINYQNWLNESYGLQWDAKHHTAKYLNQIKI